MPSRQCTAIALGAAAAAITLLHASGARAFCRAYTASPPSDYDVAKFGCFGDNSTGGIYELYWKSAQVGYSLQSGASKQVTLQQATTIAAQAFGAWSQVSCAAGGMPSITAVATQPVSCNMVEFNQNGPNQHVIIFRDDAWPYQDGNNTLGYTTLQASRNTGEIYDADMEINSAQYTLVVGGSGPAPAGSYDLLGILTHEAGHFLGLAHSGSLTAVMFAHYVPGSTTLTPDDVSGICAIYAPDGTRGTSAGSVPEGPADPTPIGGFSTDCGSASSAVISYPDAGTTVDSSSMPCPANASCATAGGVGRGSDTDPLGLFAVAGVAAATLTRRRRLRAAAAAIGIGLAAVSSFVLERDAKASVSIAATLEELVHYASACAVVTVTEQRSVSEAGRIATYTKVRVDQLVAGKLPAELWIKTRTGTVGDVVQIVDGEASFAVGDRSLVFLRPDVDPVSKATTSHFVVVERAQGQYPVVVGQDGIERLVRAADLGMVLPPSAPRLADLARAYSTGGVPRLASSVLHARRLDDAIAEIASLFTTLHATD